MNGSSQRHGSRFSKSPSFLLPGLTVVIIILSFNYWRTSRLNRELLESLSRHQARSDKLDHEIDVLKGTGAEEIKKCEADMALMKRSLDELQEKSKKTTEELLEKSKTTEESLRKEVEEKSTKILDLEGEKTELEAADVKTKEQIDKLNSQIQRLNATLEECNTARSGQTEILEKSQKEKETIFSFVASELGKEGVETLLQQQVTLPESFQMPSADQLAGCSKRAEEKCKLENKPMQVVVNKNPPLQSPNAERADLPRGQAQGPGQDSLKSETGNPAPVPVQSQGDNSAVRVLQTRVASGLKEEVAVQPSDKQDESGEQAADGQVVAGDVPPAGNVVNSTKAVSGLAGAADAGAPAPGLQVDQYDNSEQDADADGDDDDDGKEEDGGEKIGEEKDGQEKDGQEKDGQEKVGVGENGVAIDGGTKDSEEKVEEGANGEEKDGEGEAEEDAGEAGTPAVGLLGRQPNDGESMENALGKDEMVGIDSGKVDTRAALKNVFDDDGDEPAGDEEKAAGADQSETTPVVVKESSGTAVPKIPEV